MSNPCPTCDKASLETRPYTRVVKIGRYKVTDATGWAQQCSACGEALLDSKTVTHGDLRAALVVLAGAPDINGNELRLVRKKFGLTQAQLAELFAVVPVTISRLEQSEGPIDQLYQLGLVAIARGILEHGDDADAYLEARRHPPEAKEFTVSAA